ncbi:hypothetical protein K474DRAFT_1756051 [Panus rudis PR-1116 ss-1]|nr:hypothetical protein K474DRAFT_1756051 [Panus rudis PR-1116 ss-1]
MPDWMSPESLTQQTAGIVNLTHVFAGIYLWEVLMSLTFEWEYLTRRRKFKWPMVCYFLVRYVALSAMVGSGLDCKSFFTFLQMAGNCARGLATINLALRTIAVWQRDRYIVVGIVLLILGHWSLIFQGVLLEAEEVPGQGCQIVHTNTKILTADFVYSMIFDLIILLLTAYKVLQLKTQSGLVSLLFYDGLIYFLCAFTANLLAAIFMILDLSPVMSIMFNVPAVVVCAIASTRAVRSLANYTNSGPNVL